MSETIIELTSDQSIAILEKAKEILGPNGERWVQEHWVALPVVYDEEVDDYDSDGGWVDAEWDDATRPEAKFCIMGAIEQAAFLLGITTQQSMTQRLANPISLEKLVKSTEGWERKDVIDVNDDTNTTWETIRGLLDGRLAQLKGESV